MNRVKVDSGSSTNQILSDKEIELTNLLHSIEVNVPKAVSGASEDKKVSLLLLAYSNRDLLVNGISNHPEMSNAEKFMYFNVFPKLHLHGLAADEAVPGTGYRRISLSEAGRKLVATLEYGFWKSGGGPAKPTEETKSPEPKVDTAAQTTNLPSVENSARVKSQFLAPQSQKRRDKAK